jgi:hypothetical protein
VSYLYGPHPWTQGGAGPGPDEAQRAAGTFGEPAISEQLWAAQRDNATQNEMVELARRWDAQAHYRRTFDAQQRTAYVQRPQAPTRPDRSAHGYVPWPPRMPRPPIITDENGEPNSLDAIRKQRAAFGLSSERVAQPRRELRAQSAPSQAARRPVPRQPYQPRAGYYFLKTVALIVFLISVIPATLTILVGKPIAGWIVACVLSAGTLILQAIVKRYG